MPAARRTGAIVAWLAASWLLLCATAAADDDDGGVDYYYPECDFETSVDVMAVMHAEGQPGQSLAMLTTGPGKSRLVSVGSWIVGRPVLAITPAAVWLGPQEFACFIRLDHEGSQRVTRRHKSEKRRKKRRRKRRKKR